MRFDYKIGVGIHIGGNVTRQIELIQARFAQLEKQIAITTKAVQRFHLSIATLPSRMETVTAAARDMAGSTIRSFGDMSAGVKSFRAQMFMARKEMRVPMGPARFNVIGRGGGRSGGDGGHRGGGQREGGFSGSPFFASPVGMGTLGTSIGLGYGIYESAKKQAWINRALLASDINPSGSGADRKTRQDLVTLVNHVSSLTGISSSKIAEAVLRIRQVDPYLPLSAIEKMLPFSARSATIQQQYHGTDPVESIVKFQELSHMIQKYSPKDLLKVMDYMNWAVSWRSIATLPRLMNAASYVLPTATTMLHADPRETMAGLMYMQSAGVLNTKSGTWLSNFLLNDLPKSHGSGLFKTKPQEEALRRMGLIDANGNPMAFDKKGVFHPLKEIAILHKWKKEVEATHTPAEAHAIETLTNILAFGKQGARAAALLESAGYTRLSKQLDPKNMISIRAMFEAVAKNDPMIQGRKFLNNLSLSLQKLADHVIPDLTATMTAINDKLSKIFPSPVPAGPFQEGKGNLLPPGIAKKSPGGDFAAEAARELAAAQKTSGFDSLEEKTDILNEVLKNVTLTIHDKTSGGIHAQMHRRQIHETGSTLTHSGVIPATVGGAH